MSGTKVKRCPICRRFQTRSGKAFTEETLQQHIKDAHPEKVRLEEDDPDYDPIYNMADLIAGGESDGVFWGIYDELSRGDENA